LHSKSRLPDVLVVEDDTDVRGIFYEYLTEEGYRVRVATDGQEALALLAQALPDVILTDLNMPNVDGWQLLRALAADPIWTHIPVAIMTAEENFPPGYTVFRKPFRMDAVLRFLKDACSTEHAAAGSSTANTNDAEE
jgi:CheY-like chemotaxis protein